MYDIVEGIHKAFKIESTWAFVLLIAFGAAVVGGFFAWVIDVGYRNSPEYKAEHPVVRGQSDPKSQAVTTSSPITPVTAQKQVVAPTAVKTKRTKPPVGPIQTTQPISPVQHDTTVARIVKNAGDISNLRVEDNKIVAPVGSDAETVENLPGAKMAGVVEHNEVSVGVGTPIESQGAAAGAAVKISGGVSGDVVDRSVLCGVNTQLEASGKNSDITVTNGRVNTANTCEWAKFLFQVGSHRADIVAYMDKWSALMEEDWTSISPEMRDSYRSELKRIKNQLIDAADDQVAFDRVRLRTLWDNPPSFRVKRLE
ncbi:MAG: hypothetical protein WBQ09_01515 [Terriglobales bacterium]